MKKYKVGILGATGMVGQKFLKILENHPWFEVSALAASSNSAGKTYKEAAKWAVEGKISEKYENMIIFDAVNDIDEITGLVDFVFCAVGLEDEKTKQLEEFYAKKECPVISNNSAHRWTPDVPMIIPELNADHMDIIPYQRKRLDTKHGFIAVKSNCSIQSYIPALYPLLDLGLKNILACTYQAISGAGKTFDTWPEMQDNLIPFIGGEEEKSEKEPLKILGKIENGKIISSNAPNITTQCFRVPVSTGHTAAVFASFEKKVSIEEILKKWDDFKGDEKSLGLPSSPKKFLTYFKEESRPQIAFERNLYNGMGISIGRLREDSQYDIKFVCMSHNTVRGAAGGAVLMAEMLCKQGLIEN